MSQFLDNLSAPRRQQQKSNALGITVFERSNTSKYEKKTIQHKKCLEGASTRLLIGWNERL
jgi:hypothetical protein